MSYRNHTDIVEKKDHQNHDGVASAENTTNTSLDPVTHLTSLTTSPSSTSSPSFIVVDLNSDHSIGIDQASPNEIVKDKDLQKLEKNGVKGGALALETAVECGEGKDVDNITHQKQVFGSNTYTVAPFKGVVDWVVKAFKDGYDSILILLLFVCAVLSFCFGIKEHGHKEGFYNGGTILVAIIIFVCRWLSPRRIGDQVLLKEVPPLTAETDAVAKNTTLGQILSSTSPDDDLKEKVNKLSSFIEKVRCTVDGFGAFVLLVCFFTGKTKDKNGVRDFNGSKTKFHDIINAIVRILADAVTSVSIPKGLLLALSLTYYSMKKMMANKACETMGSASVANFDSTTQGARNAVEDSQHAGVNVKMIKGDNSFHRRWVRSVYINTQKFVQFQLTMNVAALVINIVAALSAEELPDTALKSLWVNLIMDFFGALALATENPTMELKEKLQITRPKSLINNVMLRNLLFQALYQIAVSLFLQFGGKSIFGVTSGVNDTLIFNTFVLCQVFNQFNAREMEKKNVFKGIHRNKLFLGIIVIIIFLQVMMVEVKFLNKLADTEKLTLKQWAICIGLAAFSLPIGLFVKFIPVPDKPFTSVRSVVCWLTCMERR